MQREHGLQDAVLSVRTYVMTDKAFSLFQVMMESQVDEIGLVTGSAESAALRLRVPLQQVQAQQSPFLTNSTWILMAVTLQILR